jgi:hypothetical protein
MAIELPNYFLADLPPEATVSPQTILEACQTLKHNRERYLLTRSTQSLVEVLSEIAAQWQRPDYQFRRLALSQGPAATGFPEGTLAKGLDAFFGQMTSENLTALLIQELGHVRRLDDVVSAREESLAQKGAVARGPEFLVHFAAGNLPIPAFMSIVLGLLVRSAQFMKCASGTAFLPRLLAHSLYQIEPKLGACLEIAAWRGGNQALESILLTEADCVTATGADETLLTLRQQTPLKTRFLDYGHRVSFAYVTHRALMSLAGRQLVMAAARDVSSWNQLGCLSPHVFYVENGRNEAAVLFAEQLAKELSQLEVNEPRGILPLEFASAIATRRSFYEIRAAHSPDTQLWCSPNSTAWTVVYENDPLFQVSCLNRFVYVKGVHDLTEALHGADAIRDKTSTVAVGAEEEDYRRLALQLARWGATRICPLGKMQQPSLSWRHDGRPALADLVTWTDCEL